MMILIRQSNQSRIKFLLMGLLIVSASSLASADVTVVEDRSDDRGVRSVYKMVVSPAAEPVPALRYRLTIEPHKTIPGNAVTHYLRSFGENSLNGPWKSANSKYGDEIDGLYYGNAAIKNGNLEKLREVAGYFDAYVENHIRRATLCRDCDWGLAEEELRGPESIGFLLPSVQQTRMISRALALRTRLAIAEGRFDDAIDHLRMNYQLGRNVSKMRFLVCSLVGVAEAGIANQGMIDFIAADNAPNMFWALAELPRPIIDIREAIRLEMSLVPRVLPVLLDVETAEYSQAQWTKLVSQAASAAYQIGQQNYATENWNESNLQMQFLALAGGLVSYSSAKHRLIDGGMSTEKVAQMPVGKVILLDAARDYQRAADDQEKSFYVPYHQSRKIVNESENKIVNEEGQIRLGAMLAGLLLPASSQVRTAQMRVEWQLNALQNIEAIRMHLATNGKLPKTLEEIEVPVPLNPFTNQPYSYQLNGETAVLDLPFSDGVPGIAQRFEIRVRSE